MAIKNILVAYNGGEASNAALHMGVQMANKYDAHLTGIMAHGASNITRSIPKWLLGSVQDSISDIVLKRTDEVAEKFQSFMDGELPSERIHWIDVKANPDLAVSHYARLFDVTVVGQYENLLAADELELHPDRIAYSSGRPIIVAPKSHAPASHAAGSINEKAVVAWDGRRTASRAFFDAMHILETKSNVTIVTIGGPKTGKKQDQIDLQTIMKRHGVDAKHLFLPRTEKSIATTLLDVCKQENAGLLVMGAYEHSKLAEDIWGGVTSQVLEETHLPLFLSH